jgi:hypothetical protein
MHKHTQTTHGKEKPLCINLRMFVQWLQRLDCNRVSILSFLHSSLPICSPLMNLDTKIFYKRGDSRAFPSKLPTLINYIELHSMSI